MFSDQQVAKNSKPRQALAVVYYKSQMTDLYVFASRNYDINNLDKDTGIVRVMKLITRQLHAQSPSQQPSQQPSNLTSL